LNRDLRITSIPGWRGTRPGEGFAVHGHRQIPDNRLSMCGRTRGRS